MASANDRTAETTATEFARNSHQPTGVSAILESNCGGCKIVEVSPELVEVKTEGLTSHCCGASGKSISCGAGLSSPGNSEQSDGAGNTAVCCGSPAMSVQCCQTVPFQVVVSCCAGCSCKDVWGQKLCCMATTRVTNCGGFAFIARARPERRGLCCKATFQKAYTFRCAFCVLPGCCAASCCVDKLTKCECESKKDVSACRPKGDDKNGKESCQKECRNDGCTCKNDSTQHCGKEGCTACTCCKKDRKKCGKMGHTDCTCCCPEAGQGLCNEGCTDCTCCEDGKEFKEERSDRTCCKKVEKKSSKTGYCATCPNHCNKDGKECRNEKTDLTHCNEDRKESCCNEGSGDDCTCCKDGKQCCKKDGKKCWETECTNCTCCSNKTGIKECCQEGCTGTCCNKDCKESCKGGCTDLTCCKDGKQCTNEGNVCCKEGCTDCTCCKKDGKKTCKEGCTGSNCCMKHAKDCSNKECACCNNGETACC